MLLSWLTDLGSMCKLRLLRSSFNSWIIFLPAMILRPPVLSVCVIVILSRDIPDPSESSPIHRPRRVLTANQAQSVQ